MNSGALRDLVTLDWPTAAGVVPLEPPTVYAELLDDATGTATVRCRYHAGITTATRLHYKGRTYHIDGISNTQGRDDELVLTCHEVYE
jgi:head-tail adaptor